MDPRERLTELYREMYSLVDNIMEENDDLRKRLRKYEAIDFPKRKTVPKLRGTMSSMKQKLKKNRRGQEFTFSRLLSYVGHEDSIFEVSTANWNTGIVASASADRTARIWSADGSAVNFCYANHRGAVNSIRAHPTLKFMLTSSGDGTCHVWAVPSLRGAAAAAAAANYDSPPPPAVLSRGNSKQGKKVAVSGYDDVGDELKASAGGRVWTPLLEQQTSSEAVNIPTSTERKRPTSARRAGKNSPGSPSASPPTAISSSFLEPGRFTDAVSSVGADAGASIPDADAVDDSEHSSNSITSASALNAASGADASKSGGGFMFEIDDELAEHEALEESNSDVADALVTENALDTVLEELPHNELIGHAAPVIGADWLLSGDRIVSASWDATVRLWDSVTFRAISSVPLSRDNDPTFVSSCVVENTFTVCTSEGNVSLFDTRDSAPHEVTSFAAHDGGANACEFFIDGKTFASCGEDSSVKMWDMRKMGSTLCTVRLSSVPNRLSISPLTSCIAVPCDDKRTRIYDTSGAKCSKFRHEDKLGHKVMLSSVAWSADESCIFTAAIDGTLLSWGEGR